MSISVSQKNKKEKTMVNVIAAFDCHEMPNSICRKYMELPENRMKPNDVWLEWFWEDFYTVWSDGVYNPSDESEKNRKEIQDWMLEQGLRIPENWGIEDVILVKHWW